MSHEFEKNEKNIINTGTSEQDYGFEVLNIKRSNCDYIYESIYATIFNFLQRSRVIYKDIVIEDLRNEKCCFAGNPELLKNCDTIQKLAKQSLILPSVGGNLRKIIEEYLKKYE
jgi:hypothetical protein